jgi:hypothetical protein
MTFVSYRLLFSIDFFIYFFVADYFFQFTFLLKLTNIAADLAGNNRFSWLNSISVNAS